MSISLNLKDKEGIVFYSLRRHYTPRKFDKIEMQIQSYEIHE